MFCGGGADRIAAENDRHFVPNLFGGLHRQDAGGSQVSVLSRDGVPSMPTEVSVKFIHRPLLLLV